MANKSAPNAGAMDAAPWLPNLARLQLTECGTPGDGSGESGNKNDKQPPTLAPPLRAANAEKSWLEELPRDIAERIGELVAKVDCRDIGNYCAAFANLRDVCKTDNFWRGLCELRGWDQPVLSIQAINALIEEMPEESQETLLTDRDSLPHKVIFVLRCILLPTPYLKPDANLVVCYHQQFNLRRQADVPPGFDYAYDTKNRTLVMLDKPRVHRDDVMLPSPEQLAMSLEECGDGSAYSYYPIETLVLPMRCGLPSNKIPDNFVNEIERDFVTISHNLLHTERSTNLKAVRHLEGIEEIGEGAFRGQDQLDLSLPESLRIIESAAFMDCRSLTLRPEDSTQPDPGPQLPRNLTFLGQAAFLSCESLRQLTLPASLKFIGLNVFLRCHRDLVVTFEKSVGFLKCAAAKLFDPDHPMVAVAVAAQVDMIAQDLVVLPNAP